LLADYTDAVGIKAKKYTSELEKQFDSKMSEIDCFNTSKQQTLKVESFYKKQGERL